ncbi:MAG: DUF4430 domain-containing protein [archaeon]|nr:MAG: DUF4430 domain-containing protein [archaeon]
MAGKGLLYGVVVVMVAGILLTSTLAVQYYALYQAQASASEQRAGELSVALAKYNSLATDYRTSLRDYNTTLSLLAKAVANLNTSTPAYVNASRALATLWASYKELASAQGGKPLVYQVRMLLDFGNGTSRWYNDTSIQPGWDGYVATLVFVGGRVDATWYPQYGEHFINGIGGVENDYANDKSWTLWTWNSAKGWQSSTLGADQVQLANGTVFAWAYCGYDPNTFVPTCSRP